MTTFCHRRHHTNTPPSLSPRNGPPHWRLASTSWGDSLQAKTTTAETTLSLLIIIPFPTQYDRATSAECSEGCTAVLSKTSHANCCTTLINRPSRGRRGRFVRVVHQLACEGFERTAVPPATTNQNIDRPSVASEVGMDGQEPGTHPTWIKAD